MHKMFILINKNQNKQKKKQLIQLSLIIVRAQFTRELSNGKLSALDVICGKDSMTVRAEFNGRFNGIIFSKGTYGQNNCIYVKHNSDITDATFKVYFNQCGTKPDLDGKYYENTIIIQYGNDIIEAWDEAKRLRCEWFEAYEKPATFRPAIPVADLDIIEMNFQGDDIDCWMEIKEGKGPFGKEINRIVPVGTPMSIVISINDHSSNGQFDMRVKSCKAEDGNKPPIQLTDDYGCVLRKKMLTPFKKIKDPNGKATIISYSNFYAFKFPDSMDVQITCTVEVCRHGCPEACSKLPYNSVSSANNAKINSNIKKSETSMISSSLTNYLNDNIPSESEAKPIVKVFNIDIPGNGKKPIISEKDISSLKEEDLHAARKILKNLGVSEDIAHFASKTISSSDNKQIEASKKEPAEKSSKIHIKSNDNNFNVSSLNPIRQADDLRLQHQSMNHHTNHFIQNQHQLSKDSSNPIVSVYNVPLGLVPSLNNNNNNENYIPPFPLYQYSLNEKSTISNHFLTQFPHGPRSFRSKRSVLKPEINLNKGFQVVTSIDLAFSPNASEDIEIFEGRREIDHTICLPFNGLVTMLSIIGSLMIIICGISLFFIQRIKKSSPI